MRGFPSYRGTIMSPTSVPAGSKSVGLAGNVPGGRLADGARNDVTLEIDRHKARVRTVFGDGEQIGVAALLRDGLGESGGWHRCGILALGVSGRVHRRING
jgi:hypothetical protein